MGPRSGAAIDCSFALEPGPRWNGGCPGAVRAVFDVSDAAILNSGQGVYISEVRAILACAVDELSDATLVELLQWLDRRWASP